MRSAPASIMSLSSTPVLKRVPRIRKFSAGRSPRSFVPQASLSHSRFDSKPPAARTQALASIRSPPMRAATKREPSSSMPSTGAS